MLRLLPSFILVSWTLMSLSLVQSFQPQLQSRPQRRQQQQQQLRSNGGTFTFTRLFVSSPPTSRTSPSRDAGSSNNRPIMNQEITAPQLRVVTPNPKGKDEALGIMTREEAFLKAKELGDLDLIIINENSDPPVCKIVDYSKYRYSQEKKAKEVKKNSKTSELKEVKMSYKIDVHDYDVRKKSAYKFLRAGNRVKCTVTFRGREVQHDKLGFELLEKLASELEDTCIKEGNPKKEGRNFLSLILTPRPEVMKAININRRAQDKAKKQKKVQTNDDDDDDDEDDDDDAPEDVVEGTTAPKAGEKKIKVEKTLEEILGTDEYL